MGFDCSPAAALKCIGIRKMSLPFDWVQSTPELIIACIKDNFKQFHQNIRLKNGGTRVVDTYGFQYPHDYPTNGGENDGSEKELVDNYGEYTESVLAKYARRIERLRGLLTDNKPIIILMRSSYKSAYNMKRFIDQKYNKDVIIILATKEPPLPASDKTPYIICCDPEYQSKWNDRTVWETAIAHGKRIYEINRNATAVNKYRNWKMF